MAEQRTRRARPARGPIGTGEKPKNFSGSLKHLLAHIARYKFTLIAVVLMAVGSTVFAVIGPKVMAQATNALADGLMRKIAGTGGIDFTYIGKILLITLAIYVLSSAMNFLQGWLMTSVTNRICFALRRDITAKINRMPMKYFETRSYGDILSRISNDVDTIGMGLNMSLVQIITSLVTLIGVLVMMLTISPLMTLIAICVIPISILLISIVVKRSQPYFRAQQEYLGKVNGQVEEDYGGHLVIKAFSREDAVLRDFDETNDILFRSAWKSQFLSGLMQPMMVFVGNLGYVAVAISGGALAIRGIIGIGDIQAFIQYVKNLTQPIQQMATIINQLQSMTAASERVFEFLSEEEEPAVAEHPVRPEDVKGNIGFSHVAFGYNPEQPVIHDFSVQVTPGQKIAIVGPTGAGKTTIVKLLLRFYDVDAGSITLEGQDIRDYDRHELRDQFAMVLQDTWLFRGTIRENIRYGRPDATDAEVEQAADAALVDHFIRTLPGGYDMELNEEATNVSQGQKQLLTIARAILADRKILILDEATSSVDTRTEELIQKAMDRLMENRTSFIIAHRLSTIRNADRILVMKEGDIVEQGTHTELLQKNGFYAELYNSQFAAV